MVSFRGRTGGYTACLLPGQVEFRGSKRVIIATSFPIPPDYRQSNPDDPADGWFFISKAENNHHFYKKTVAL